MPDAMCHWIDANPHVDDDDDDDDEDNVDDGIKFEAPKPSSETHIHVSLVRFLLVASVIFDYLWLWLRYALLFCFFVFFLLFFLFCIKCNKIQGATCCLLPVGFYSPILFHGAKCCLFVFLVLHFRGATFAQSIFFYRASFGRYHGKGTKMLEDKCVANFYYRWNDDGTFQLNFNSSVYTYHGHGIETFCANLNSNEAKRIRFHFTTCISYSTTTECEDKWKSKENRVRSK